MKAVIKAVACAVAIFASAAQATPLLTNANFGSGATVVTFSEVSLASGTAVTNQFASYGLTFASNGSPFAIGSGAYASAAPVDASYLDSFSGGGTASAYDIVFSNDVTAAGAFWEFNSPSTATFTAMNSGVAVESFVYSNASCCYSAEFIGFSGISFDTLRVSNITGTHFYMDAVTFEGASVPEPTGVALLGIAALGLAATRRRKQARKAV